MSPHVTHCSMYWMINLHVVIGNRVAQLEPVLCAGEDIFTMSRIRLLWKT